MIARFRNLLIRIGDEFWLLPAGMVAAAILAALGLIALDRGGTLPAVLRDGPWLYNGGASGARTLLGAVASSTIGIAGTVFTITIAALSLAANQMGPRLLRNFMRDRGNQVTLGIFLGTFSFALMVLRSVRGEDEGAFVPPLALTAVIVLALVCVVTLVFFVGHMAARINVDTVIDLVGADVRAAIGRLTVREAQPAPPPATFWRDATVVADSRQGYLQQLDAAGLADWAAANDTAMHLLVRPGGHVFPGAPIALLARPAKGAADAVRDATALGPQRASPADLEFQLRQLVEVAVRALSPGTNDPNTAVSVLDRLGAALCQLAPLHLPTGVHLRDGRPALVVPGVDYDGLVDAMFHQIRQNGLAHPAVIIRLLEVIVAAASVETAPARLGTLRRHADLVLADAVRGVPNPADLQDIRDRHARLVALRRHGAVSLVAGDAA